MRTLLAKVPALLFSIATWLMIVFVAQARAQTVDVVAESKPPQTAFSRKILITSKLHGYFRLPNRQPFVRSKSDPRCAPPNNPADASPDANVLFGQLKDIREDNNPILVGTGDNFAPNYYSRVFYDANQSGNRHPLGKDFYQWNGSEWVWYEDTPNKAPAAMADAQAGIATIPTDNVACFLSYARYDALVPGKHDFYYGPERLRQLARFLAGDPKHDDPMFPPVQMLGANMMIKTTWVSDHAPIPDSGKPALLFTTRYVPVSFPDPASTPARKLEIVDFTDSGFAFPWTRFVRVNSSGWDPKQLQVYLCEANKKNPDDFVNAQGSCGEALPLARNDDASKAAVKDSGDDGSSVFDLPKGALHPGKNYAICIPPPEVAIENRSDQAAKEAKPYCFRFAVYNPFFQFPNWNDAAHSGPNQLYRNPALYKLREDSGKKPVVIFGIVDPQLGEHVGGDNFAWRTVRGTPGPNTQDDKRFSTQLYIADPVRTLIHLQDYFEEEYSRNHKAAFDGIRVLLAQMTPEAAKQLAEHLPRCLRFDVIVTAADDGLATPNESVQFLPTAAQNDAVCGFRVGASGLSMKGKGVTDGSLVKPATFIAVPPSHEQPSRFVHLRELDISGNQRPNLSYALKGDPLPVSVPATASVGAIAAVFWGDVAAALPLPPAIWSDATKKIAIQQLTLWAIHEKYKTDVALLQTRDFYIGGIEDYLAEHCTSRPTSKGTEECDPEKPLTLDPQEILDRILWKGDSIKVKSLTGSVLKSVLKQSAQFSKAEKTSYLSVSESGRPLVRLGIEDDPVNGGDFLINDKPLDPNALYTVATSDYIGLGDTGYPDLASEPVGTPPPASEVGQITSISGATCEAMAVPASNCHVKVNIDHYYDELANRKPDDQRKGNSPGHKLFVWSLLSHGLGQPTPEHPILEPADAIVNGMQKRLDAEKNWVLSLSKASFGFSGLGHNGSEQDLSNNFSGVQNGQVNAKHFHSFDWDANSNFSLFRRKYDWFASETLQYSSSFTAQVSPPRSETQSRNQFAFDGGTYLHPWSVDKGFWKLSAVAAGHFETQVANPLGSISLNGGSSSLSFKQGRTHLLLGRLGSRFQNRKSYAEAGFEGGEVLNAIKAFQIETTAGGPVAQCNLTASQTLSNCVKLFNQSNPGTPVTSDSRVTVARSSQPRYGVYWNMGLTVPLGSNIAYTLQESSDHFFNSSGDNSADTRYRHQLINSLKFNVLPNLSFEPTYTLFFYQNKVDYHYLRQQKYSININYSFDWTNFGQAGQQLLYKKPGI